MEDGSYRKVGGTDSMSIQDTESGLPHQKKTWSQHDLLASVLSSYVDIVHEKGGRWPSWGVSSRTENIHADLKQVNAHLDRLGWMAKLTKDEAWVMTVFPIPERQFPRVNSLVAFWILSFFTLTLAGNVWMSSVRPDGGWFHSSTFLDAVLGYALPVMVLLFCASFVQRKVAQRYGVRAGHLIPVPDLTIALYAMGLFPSSWLFWPFGILLIPTMPRMDARPWPDRASLGYTALSVPLVLGLSGVALFLIGLGLTPEYLPHTTMPLVTDAPMFLSVIATELIVNDAMIRLLWAHPFVHAGGMLMLFAWISLLPIPTFPGGRLLIARMGLFDARSSSTQSLILVIMLFAAFVFGVFENFSLWFLVFALLLPLLFFFGSDLRIPLLLDETTGLSEDDHRRMGMMLLVVFVLLLPASQPVVHERDWDAPMTYEIEGLEPAILLENGTWLSRNKILVTNPSAIESPYAVSAVFAHQGHAWQIEWDCDGEDERTVDGQGCGSLLLPKRTAFFWVNLTWNATTSPLVSDLSFIVDINNAYTIEAKQVRPSIEVAPSEQWYDRIVGSQVSRCLQLHGTLLEASWLDVEVGGSSMTDVQTSLVQLEGETGMVTNLSAVPSELCLNGLDPLVFESSMATLRLNNHTFTPLLPQRRPLVAHVPDSGWSIHSNATQGWGALLNEGGVLQIDTAECPINPSISTPLRPLDGDWIWDGEIRTSAQLPVIESEQNLTLLLAANSNVSLCTEPYSPYPSYEMEVVEGPELVVTWMNSTTRFWTSPWAIASSGTLLNNGMSELLFHNPSNTSVPFRLSREGGFGEEWGHNWDGFPLAPGNTTLLFEPPSTPLSTMWVSYESGTVVVHLASYL